MKKWTILEWKLTITLLIQTKQGNQKTSFLPLFPQFSVILYPETKTHKYAFESPMITYSPRLRPQIDGKPTKHKILINKSCIHHVFLLVAEQRVFFYILQLTTFQPPNGRRTSHFWITHMHLCSSEAKPTSEQQNEVSLFLYQRSQSTMSTVSHNQPSLHTFSSIPRPLLCACHLYGEIPMKRPGGISWWLRGQGHH